MKYDMAASASEQGMREKYARDFLGFVSRGAVPGIGKI